jgi:hypothetical protein
MSGMVAGFLRTCAEDEYSSPDTAPAFARFKAAAGLL